MTSLQYSRIIFLVGICPTVFAFLPTNILNKIVISNLETIVNTNAISSSFFINFKREFDLERAFLQFVPMHITCTTCYIYLSIVLTVLYGQWRFFEGSQSKITKFRKIDRFSHLESVIKNILFLIIVILMKDVESAS